MFFTTKRYKFLCWLMYKVFKKPEGADPNKFLIFVEAVLFPIDWFVTRYQPQYRWEWTSNHYVIHGYRVSAKDLHGFLIEKGTKINSEKDCLLK